MLDIHFVREQPDLVRENIKKKGKTDKLPLVDEVLEKDALWRKVKKDVDDLRKERNSTSEKINAAKKAGEDISEIVKQAKEIPAKLKKIEEEEQQLRERIDTILRALPNILDPEVPEGAGEEDNVVREELGERTQLSFEPKSHVELAENLGTVDFESSRKSAGQGFFYLKGDLALLDLALQRFTTDIMVEKGFSVVIPPYMIRKQIIDGVVDPETFAELVYKIEDEDSYLIATSEHSLIGMFVDQTVEARELPVTICGVSPCFRKELGAHGIDEKGLYRTHQFFKVEQIVLCTPEQSREWYDKLLEITKEIFSKLGLSTRVLESCAGDLGDLKARGSDLEAWSPRRQGYFEIGSCSNLTDAQARRLNIRMVHPDGKREFVHTLNNTALATSRAMVAILENFQQEDGTVKIPKVLVPYMYGKTVMQ